jgi:Mg-chelatase subunit ChlD
MSLSRWGSLSGAISEFAEALGETTQSEYVSLVSYASQCTYCSVTNNRSDIDLSLTSDTAQLPTKLGVISNRVFNGMTNIGAGVDNARTVLNAGARPFAVKTMVLMSDGHWNDGRDPVDAAEDALAEDIVIHTISFGEANQSEMAEIAAMTGGQHYHADEAADLAEIYRKIAFTLPVVMTE